MTKTNAAYSGDFIFNENTMELFVPRTRSNDSAEIVWHKFSPTEDDSSKFWLNAEDTGNNEISVKICQGQECKNVKHEMTATYKKEMLYRLVSSLIGEPMPLTKDKKIYQAHELGL